MTNQSSLSFGAWNVCIACSIFRSMSSVVLAPRRDFFVRTGFRIERFPFFLSVDDDAFTLWGGDHSKPEACVEPWRS